MPTSGKSNPTYGPADCLFRPGAPTEWRSGPQWRHLESFGSAPTFKTSTQRRIQGGPSWQVGEEVWGRGHPPHASKSRGDPGPGSALSFPPRHCLNLGRWGTRTHQINAKATLPVARPTVFFGRAHQLSGAAGPNGWIIDLMAVQQNTKPAPHKENPRGNPLGGG